MLLYNKQYVNMRIALVHDWLTAVGGAEMVLQKLHQMYPDAPIYTLFHDKKFTDTFLPDSKIYTSSLQRIYKFGRFKKLLLPLIPAVAESFDLREYDVVISSSAAYSKGVITRPNTLHISYCYSPTRQLWDWQSEYRSNAGILRRIPIAIMQHYLRLWDRSASARAEHTIAISKHVQQRIEKYYRRRADVIYPPVYIPQNLPVVSDDGYYLIVSRLYSHKNIDIAIRAFNKLGLPLRIVGDGPQYRALKKIAGPTITFAGNVSSEILWQQYARCRAFIMPQEEDFGIAPLEAMACGKPVLALARGGALEYVTPGVTGELFEDPVFESLADGVRRLNETLPAYDYARIKTVAQNYDSKHFENKFSNYVQEAFQKHHGIH